MSILESLKSEVMKTEAKLASLEKDLKKDYTDPAVIQQYKEIEDKLDALYKTANELLKED